MEIYNSEEEQIDAIKRWFKTNGSSTLIGLSIGVLLLFGWNYWKSYDLQQREQASLQYQKLLGVVENKNKEGAQQLSQHIIKEFGNTAYSAYAELIKVKLKVDSDDIDGAKAILEQLVTTAPDEGLKNVARIRLVRLLLATGQYEEGLKMIAEADPEKTANFNAEYEELTGDLYLGLGRLGEARTSYQKAMVAGRQSPLLQLKMGDVALPKLKEKTD
ncbi:MAG: tetratricopeptide repeat protein [Methylococcaceae bacterium]